MSKKVRKVKKNYFLNEVLEQGHICHRDKFENSIITKCDLAIIAQNIAAESGIKPSLVLNMISRYYA